MKHHAPKIVFIESNTTGTGKNFLTTAREKGLQVLFLTQNPSKYPFLLECLIHPVVLNTDDIEKIVLFLKQYKNIVGILSSSEYYISIAAEAAKYFRYKHNNVQAIGNCRNKYRFYQKCVDKGVKVPKSFLVNDIDDFVSKGLGESFLPVVAKPLSGSGSMSVKLCKTFLSLKQHLSNMKKNNSRDKILIQEFIEGKEYSIETITNALGKHITIAVTQKHLSEPPYFLEMGHDIPAKVSSQLKKKLVDVAGQTLNALGYSFGPAHIEVRVQRGIPYVIEVNPRLAGGMIPKAIEYATGVDLIGRVIDIYCGHKLAVSVLHKLSACIRFFVAKKAGVIKCIDVPKKTDNSLVKELVFTKKPGDYINIRHDFTDRFGCVITAGKTASENSAVADELVSRVKLKIQRAAPPRETGLIQQTLKPEILSLLENDYCIEDKIEEFNYYATIDRAHIAMLVKQNIVDKRKAKVFLDAIDGLEAENFISIKDNPAPRGLYYVYENYLIDKLGITLGGSVHIGRSRNDINATIAQLRLRKKFFDLYKSLWRVRSSLLTQAALKQNEYLPVYSQYQTALPGTLAFYYLAIENAFTRYQATLKTLFKVVNVSPLGAAACGGTSVPIDPAYTAKLLGFKLTHRNALDAIANRDSLLQMSSIINLISITVCRFMQDLQLWSTREFGLIDFPDNLVGGSSAMPQKRNPYIIERIKASSAAISGYYQAILATISKTPYSNSVEIGTESLKPFNMLYTEALKGLNIIPLIVADISINQERAIQILENNFTLASYAAEKICQEKKLSFRQAHHQVGKKIRDNLNADVKLSHLLHDESIDLPKYYENNNYGGGAGHDSTNKQILHARRIIDADSRWIYSAFI